MPFVFPDPIYGESMLSGATWLFFEEPLLLSIPAQLVTPDSVPALGDLVTKRRPEWSNFVTTAFANCRTCRDGTRRMQKLLEPLSDDLRWVWLAYGADQAALQRAKALVSSAGTTGAVTNSVVDLPTAYCEVVRHLFLEMWLEVGKDPERLFQYCETSLGATADQRSMLLHCYFIRFGSLLTALGSSESAAILLTNPQLIPFITASDEQEVAQADSEGERSVASWEVFRQIVGVYTDPLRSETVELIAECLAERREEAHALRVQCERLAAGLAQLPRNRVVAESKVRALIEREASEAIAALLRLSTTAKREFLERVMTDKATWLSLIAAVGGMITDTTSVGAIGATSLGASALASGAAAFVTRRTTLRESPYRLIYHLDRGLTNVLE